MTRVMKARRSSALSCGHYVLVGRLIVNRGDGWRCLDCALADIETSAGITAAAPAKEE